MTSTHPSLRIAGLNVGCRLLSLLLLTVLSAPVSWAQTPSPDALRTQFDALREKGTGQLTDRSINLRSSETADRMQGEVQALI
ncbi:hypothetical protein, partial [Hydrogenophaga sp.]|uniref:hypothetical protein n=1 Tax=Hydrogenophaga sp. TaxID=1904254 RepID=UPI00271F4627